MLLAQALCLRKLGKTDEAIRILDKFMESNPSGLSLANGLYEEGLAFVEKGQFNKAIVALERVLSEVPDYPAKDKILFELGWAWADKQEAEKSAIRFQELIDVGSTANWDSHENMGITKSWPRELTNRSPVCSPAAVREFVPSQRPRARS